MAWGESAPLVVRLSTRGGDSHPPTRLRVSGLAGQEGPDAVRVALSSDHAGFALRSKLLTWLRGLGYDVVDVGPQTMDPNDDYPDAAQAVGEAIASGIAPRGIIVCGSGVGGAIAANKVPGVRASVCHDTYSARQGVEHDDMNLLCLGERIVGPSLAQELVLAFLGAEFRREEKYLRRLDKVIALERKAQGGGPAPSTGGT